MEIETTKMSTRGQLIIPKNIREYIKAEQNTVFVVTPFDKETLLLKKMDKTRLLSEFKKIRKNIKTKLSTSEINEEITKARKN